MLRADRCSLDDFARIVEAPTDPGRCPRATRIELGVPVYDANTLSAAADDVDDAKDLEAELADLLLHGPGIVAVTGAVPADAVDRATAAFGAMIAEQRAGDRQGGDHFAAPGANDRVWNALQKLVLADPAAFVDYYCSDAIATIARAWLGPWYQITSQVNVVNPGGQAQSPHRDYHLGFMSDDAAARYPAHVHHHLSPLLTLQGAVAHCDMPAESGPTRYLPHSHKYESGYVAWRRPDFIEYFQRRSVSFPLELGDAVFFNPAVLHAAGENRTPDVARMANLLQISSAFGRAMETVDRRAMTIGVFPTLLARAAAGMPRRHVANVIAATAEGYAFPTNLDRDLPLDGLSPSSQADVLRAALDEAWTLDELRDRLDAHHRRHLTDPA